jgi:hypothetical protein
MAQAKIEVKVGNICFSGEGDSTWLGSQLDKVLATAFNGTEDSASEDYHGRAAKTPTNDTGAGSLASFLKAKKASTNQVVKFLATAYWLHKKGENSLTTALVTKALAVNRQSKLTNPAQCLNQNVGKGYCEKKGKGFFITEEGTNSLEAVAD